MTPDAADPNAEGTFRIHTVDIEFTQPFATGPIDWTGRFYFRYNDLADERVFLGPAADDFLNAAADHWQ